MQFFFADHTLDTDRRELRRGSEHIAVEPQVFDLLSGRGARGTAGMCQFPKSAFGSTAKYLLRCTFADDFEWRPEGGVCVARVGRIIHVRQHSAPECLDDQKRA